MALPSGKLPRMSGPDVVDGEIRRPRTCGRCETPMGASIIPLDSFLDCILREPQVGSHVHDTDASYMHKNMHIHALLN
jgi:hypothetical protein